MNLNSSRASYTSFLSIFGRVWTRVINDTYFVTVIFAELYQLVLAIIKIVVGYHNILNLPRYNALRTSMIEFKIFETDLYVDMFRISDNIPAVILDTGKDTAYRVCPITFTGKVKWLYTGKGSVIFPYASYTQRDTELVFHRDVEELCFASTLSVDANGNTKKEYTFRMVIEDIESCPANILFFPSLTEETKKSSYIKTVLKSLSTGATLDSVRIAAAARMDDSIICSEGIVVDVLEERGTSYLVTPTEIIQNTAKLTVGDIIKCADERLNAFSISTKETGLSNLTDYLVIPANVISGLDDAVAVLNEGVPTVLKNIIIDYSLLSTQSEELDNLPLSVNIPDLYPCGTERDIKIFENFLAFLIGTSGISVGATINPARFIWDLLISSSTIIVILDNICGKVNERKAEFEYISDKLPVGVSLVVQHRNNAGDELLQVSDESTPEVFSVSSMVTSVIINETYSDFNSESINV